MIPIPVKILYTYIFIFLILIFLICAEKFEQTTIKIQNDAVCKIIDSIYIE